MSRKIILVTGGIGHVGSHVIEMLDKDSANQVISLDNYFTGSKKNRIDSYPGRAETGETPTKARQKLRWDTTVDIIDYIKDFVMKHPTKKR